jgi:hypothetical protein
MGSKYDPQVYRRKLIDSRNKESLFCLEEGEPGWHFAYGVDYVFAWEDHARRIPAFFEWIAKDLHHNLLSAYPERVWYGDSITLRIDAMESWGGSREGMYPVPVTEAYLKLWHPKRKWPLWVFFTADGIEFCKTSRERKGVLFAMKPFLKWGWEDPRIFEEVSRWLKKVGFEVAWTPEEAVA